MKKYYSILFALVGILGFFTSCDEDGDQLTLRDNVTVPTLTLPDLTLVRANGTESLFFSCTPIEPGFTASATYFLEACPEGNNFENVTQIYNGTTCNNIELTVNQLNSILLDGFPEDATSSVDFRIRTVLEADAGLGVDDHEYNSATVNGAATIFGLLRLDVIIPGKENQKIQSPGSDGIYEGFVKFGAGDAFTLLDPDNTITYGAGGSGLAIDGSGISVTDAGWHKIVANVNDLTIADENYFIGLVGSATPNGWDSPDQKMEYDPATKTWSITLDLVVGAAKFRKNDGWAWNMGFTEGTAGDLTGTLQQGGVGNDIPITEAGNYTVIFKILSDDAGTYEFIKN
jgi:hypothetical protein